MASLSQAASLRWNPFLDDTTRAELRRIWVDATNRGGALGFLPPVDESTIATSAEILFSRVAARADDLLVAERGDAVVGWLILERDPRTFAAHWRTLKRLQVDPAHQGHGLGTTLLREAERFAREELHLSFLLLTVRGGSGPAPLYRKVGYQEVGRVPGAMRIGPDDDRDEIIMILPLDESHARSGSTRG